MNEVVRNSSGLNGRFSCAGYARLTVIMFAFACLSLGIAIGVIARGVVGAGPDDNHLVVSALPITPDSLSASFARAASLVEPAVAHIKVADSEWSTREGSGSGVIVNPAGFILTNRHVVLNAARIRAKLAGGEEYPAKVVGEDRQTDLAVIKIDTPAPLPVARMGDSDKLNVGDWVLAIGSPFGLKQTVTAGIISAKDREDDAGATPFQQFLQTDAAINPGNSGGPLVNLTGEVIGINTQIATSTGAYNGIGFALPSSTAVEVYNQLVATGRVRRSFLGVQLQEITPQIARVNHIVDGQGVVVSELVSGSTPAVRADLMSGDVITTINGIKVKTVRELIRRVASLPVGSIATIEYVRAGEKKTAQVKLEERRDSEPRSQLNQQSTPVDPRSVPSPSNTGRSDAIKWPFGLTVRSVTPQMARTQNLDGVEGAYVSQVEPGSIADRNGISMDDVIIEINAKPVTSEQSFMKLARQLRTGDDVVIKLLRTQRGPFRRSWIVSFTMP